MATATMELVDPSVSSSANSFHSSSNSANKQLTLISSQSSSVVKIEDSSRSAVLSNAQIPYRAIPSSNSSMSSTLNDKIIAGNIGSESSPITAPMTSTDRLSLESSGGGSANGPARKMAMFNGGNPGDDRPSSTASASANNSASTGNNNSSLRPSVSNNSSLLHSPNSSNRSLTSPSVSSAHQQQPPPPLPLLQHQPPHQGGPPTPPAMMHPMQLGGPHFGNGPPPGYQILQGPPPPQASSRQLSDQPPVLPIQHPFPGYPPPQQMPHFMGVPMGVMGVHSPLARAQQLQAHQLNLQRPMGHPQLAHHHLLGLGLSGQQPLGPGMLGGPGGIGLPHRIPSSDDACASIVHSLMDHRQGGDSEQFTKRAIESLVKKLRERKEELEALIFAVTTGGAQRTRCVTIQRTLDGRLQVAGKKGFPHVIYAKIWRWPDLHKNELRHVNSCQFAFDLKLDSVCVNPFHYERVVSPCPDLMPMSSATNGDEPSPGPSSYQQQHRYDRSPGNSASPDSPSAQVASPPLMSVSQLPNNGMSGVFSPAPFLGQPATNLLNGSGGVVIASPQQPPKGSGEEPGYPGNAPSAFASIQPPCVMLRPPASSVTFKAKPPPLATPLELWCTINYFELNVQVGQPFKVPFACRTVIVDGFTDPNGVDRFCLGCLSNVHRDEVVERARPHIGKGVELRHDDAGDVWLKVLSEHSVFLESPYLDSQFGGRQAVHKIYSSAELKVFDLEYCYQQMYDQAQLVHLAKNMLRATVKGNAPAAQRLPPEMAGAPNIGVDDYQKHCVLRMSFVKGFGPDYNRKRIEDTPCWIEVKLHWPLKLLDQLLQPLDDPQYQQQQQPPQPPSQQPLGPGSVFMDPAATPSHHPQHQPHPHHPHSSPSSSTDLVGQAAPSSSSLLFQS